MHFALTSDEFLHLVRIFKNFGLTKLFIDRFKLFQVSQQCGPIALVCGLLFLAGSIGVRAIARPIRDVSDAALAVAQGNTDAVPPDHGALEIIELSSAILRMDRPEMHDVAWSEVRFDRRHVVQLVGANALPGHGFDRRREVEIAVGCSLLIRAEALRTTGLFDEDYFAYHEDVDWCLRARKWGYRILYEPHSRVYHRGSRSTVRARPAVPVDAEDDRLPGAEPAPWNPVRAYLGARNVIRLLRTHASTDDKRAFLGACARELPLELLAVTWSREGWMTLGRWEWSNALDHGALGRHAVFRRWPRGRLARGAVRLAMLPYALLIGIPLDVWRAYRAGRLEQFLATLRGLRDGYLRRPIPFARLRLR